MISLARLVIRFMLIVVALPAVILFGTSGHLDWGMAWVYVGFTGVSGIVSRLLMMRKYPDLVVERATSLSKEDAKAWDKILVPIIAIFGPLVILIMVGLDKRNGWSPEITLALQVAAFVALALGYLFSHWALMTNKFFSGTVRIQKDRGHTVVSSGPYRFVRHPGYTGGLVANLAVPLMLGSLWALVPGALVAMVFVIRTALEDKTLQNELTGYREYAAQVRYRLLPGLW